jgi:hypothetical protein
MLEVASLQQTNGMTCYSAIVSSISYYLGIVTDAPPTDMIQQLVSIPSFDNELPISDR